MIPSAWSFVLLALACYRLTRLAGWDDFPPIAAVREKLLGEEWVAEPIGTLTEDEGLVAVGELLLPGKTPESLAQGVRPAYRRPLLAHLFHCPFCIGWWISLAAFLFWVVAGDWALVVLAPFALSGVVGLLAKNLDE